MHATMGMLNARHRMHLSAIRVQGAAQMGAYETGGSGNQDLPTSELLTIFHCCC
jgi:hypothetical protein